MIAGGERLIAGTNGRFHQHCRHISREHERRLRVGLGRSVCADHQSRLKLRGRRLQIAHLSPSAMDGSQTPDRGPAALANTAPRFVGLQVVLPPGTRRNEHGAESLHDPRRFQCDFLLKSSDLLIAWSREKGG